MKLPAQMTRTSMICVTRKLIQRALKSLNIWFWSVFVLILVAFRLVRKPVRCVVTMMGGSAPVMDHITIHQAGFAKALRQQI
jgi:hypothetical protein